MTIQQVQNLLQYLGYYRGIPDDKYGPLTLQAIEGFQIVYGAMGIDGIHSPQLEAALLDAVATGKYFNPEPEENPEQPEAEPEDIFAGLAFPSREAFRCKCGGRYCNGFPVEPDRGLVLDLAEMYRRLDGDLWIGGSGLRCPQHNASIPGASKNSQHMYGLAADLYSSKSPEEMYAVAEDILGGTGGLGIYRWGIHFDKRPGKSRWDSR